MSADNTLRLVYLGALIYVGLMWLAMGEDSYHLGGKR